MEFKLWLEFEHITLANDWDSTDSFCNVQVKLPDGRQYGLNVWTYKFFHQAVAETERSGNNNGKNYIVPPDLFVQNLSRECIQLAIANLLSWGNLEKVLNPSVLALCSD